MLRIAKISIYTEANNLYILIENDKKKMFCFIDKAVALKILYCSGKNK